jgi:hypothetical protein
LPVVGAGIVKSACPTVVGFALGEIPPGRFIRYPKIYVTAREAAQFFQPFSLMNL